MNEDSLPELSREYSYSKTQSILKEKKSIELAFQDICVTVNNKVPKDEFDYRVTKASGVVKRGMTLILGPPGHGKSSLLRALSNKLPIHSGKMTYNGRTSEESLQVGIDVNKAVSYLEQVDAHIPLLTVQETLDFAQQVTGSDYDPERVPATLHAFGLTTCQDTIVGNAIYKGISGGQKRRLSLAEIIVSGGSSVLCLDSYTDGVDAVTSEQITHFLRQWADSTQGSVIATLQQPTVGLMECYDNLILMSETNIVYNGLVADVLPFFESMGFKCPADVDLCDFLIDVLSQPAVAYKNQLASGITIDQSVELISTEGDSIAYSKEPCLTHQLLLEHYDNSCFKQAINEELKCMTEASTVDLSSLDIHLSKEYPVSYRQSLYYLFKSILSRQSLLASRNTAMYIPRIVQTVCVGLLGGGVFFNTSPDNYYSRVALFSFMMNMFTYIAISELPMAVQINRVVYIQSKRSMYSAWMYVISLIANNFLLLAVETTVFTLIVYFMSNNVVNAGAYFLNLMIILCTATCVNSFFHMLTAINNTEATALAIASPSVGILFLTSGLFVTINNLKGYVVWLAYLSPWSWGLRALVNIEWHIRFNDAKADVILDNFDFESGLEWVGYAVVYMISLIIVMMAGQIYMMISKVKTFELSLGTKRNTDKDLDDSQDTSDVKTLSTLTKDLDFTPMSLTFKDLKYTVQIKNNGSVYDRTLLQSVHGCFTPGKLTALMGASGAGKTTLLDVLAGQKTSGTIEGVININGRSMSNLKRAKLTGYVEQFTDIMCPFLTVSESLMFSADMRLSTKVTKETKLKIIDEVLAILEITDIKDKLIGNAAQPSLSPSQLKRVSIGIELVANPAILFLDEPTTGLDSKAAQTVMRVVQRIARSGRTVICTIHQPSAEIFYLFDELTLLAPGGRQIFAGEVGPRSTSLVNYFISEPKAEPLAERQNPATWMLEQLSLPPENAHEMEIEVVAKAVADRQQLYCDTYKASSLFANTETAIKNVDESYGAKPISISIADPSTPTVASGEGSGDTALSIGEASPVAEARSGSGSFSNDLLTLDTIGVGEQFRILLKRTILSYTRNKKALIGRIFVITFLSIIFGLLYFNINPSSGQTAAVSTISSRVNSISFNGLVHSTTVLGVFLANRNYIYREKAAGYYNAVLYAFCILICEIVMCAIDAIFFQIPVYFMANMDEVYGKSGGVAFFEYYFAVLATNITIVMFTFFMTLLLSQPATINNAYLTFGILFAGMTVRFGSVAKGLKWFFYLSPFSRMTEAVVASNLMNNPKPVEILIDTNMVKMTASEYFIAYLGFENFNDPSYAYWSSMAVLLMWAVVFFIGACISIHTITHRNN